jgi:adenylosuccinate synthase
MIGAGVIVNPQVLIEEIERENVNDRVIVDRQCAIIDSIHIERDKVGHLKEKIGTTGTGTGPANADRIMRIGRIAQNIDSLQKYIGDVSFEVNSLLDKGSNVLIEGTQGTFLSLYHGTYPYVTSKDVTASGICSDIGIGPKRIDDVIVVFKSYTTRVGSGPMDGELSEKEITERGWSERGTVTGRLRRAAPFNMMLAKRSIMLNSATQISLTKLDVVFPQSSKICNYDLLPKEAKDFIEMIETELKVPVTLISTGPDASDMIDRRQNK